MNATFLDTGYVLALELANDQNHLAALEHWGRFAGAPPPLVTTSYVFSEIVTFFNNRGYHDKAVQVGDSLLKSAAVDLIPVDEKLLAAGWKYLKLHADKRYSLTDCISFVVMEQLGITMAFTCDQHFKQAGFETHP